MIIYIVRSFVLPTRVGRYSLREFYYTGCGYSRLSEAFLFFTRSANGTVVVVMDWCHYCHYCPSQPHATPHDPCGLLPVKLKPLCVTERFAMGCWVALEWELVLVLEQQFFRDRSDTDTAKNQLWKSAKKHQWTTEKGTKTSSNLNIITWNSKTRDTSNLNIIPWNSKTRDRPRNELFDRQPWMVGVYKNHNQDDAKHDPWGQAVVATSNSANSAEHTGRRNAHVLRESGGTRAQAPEGAAEQKN